MTKRNKLAALRKMRKMVESTHWIQGAFARNVCQADLTVKQCYCLVGLINHVAGTPSPSRVSGSLLMPNFGGLDVPWIKREMLIDKASADAHELGLAVWAAIKSLHPRARANAIEDWNDALTRKRKDVLAVLDHAIEAVA